MRLNIFKKLSDQFWGQGEASVTVPIMDGPLRPNEALDEAPAYAEIDRPDSMVQKDGKLYVASGSSILVFEDIRDGSSSKVVHNFGDQAVTCLDISLNGALAVGLDDVGINIIGGRYDGVQLNACGKVPLICTTDLVFIDEKTIIFSVGSEKYQASKWQYDLVTKGHSGSVWIADLESKDCRVLATNLSYPYGLARDLKDKDRILVSESWSSRIISLSVTKGENRKLFDVTNVQNIPGYPSRLHADPEEGCYWLTVFAPRSQLMEFVLRENRFKKRMMSEIKNPDYWIVPVLSSMTDFLEPLQEGSVIKMGVLKPWAPPRSYGLIVKLNAELNIVGSYHSRTNGKRHGILDVVRFGKRLFVASKGHGVIAAMNLSATN